MTGSPGGSRLVLCNLPTATFLRLHLHLEDLLRELALIRLDEHSASAIPTGPLRRLAPGVFGPLVEARHAPGRQAERAAAEARAVFDLDLAGPPTMAADTVEVVRLLEQADELSRQGRLLTPPTPPAEAALHRWMAEEAQAQLGHGAAPSPCPAGRPR